MPAHSIRYYPIQLNVRGKRCVVVGGGPVAVRKAKKLLEFGALVHVVSPEISEVMQEMIDAGQVSHAPKRYSIEDICDAFLVLAATNNRTINQTIYIDTRTYATLVNVADAQDECDFILPASVERPGLQVTISTSGTSPAMAKQLKELLVADLRDGTHRFQEGCLEWMRTASNSL